MNAIQVRDMFLHVSDVMVESEEFLTEIDNKIGDGDHGIGMAVGFKGVKKELEGKDYKYVNDVFHSIGMTMLSEMGGASGVLFGTVFVSGIVGYDSKTIFTLADFGKVFVKSLEMLKKRGKAQIGDKTMIDALEPAARALAEGAERGYDMKEGFSYAAAEAERGMEFTKSCRARFGRAKYYGDDAVGLQDAGATSVSIIFSAMNQWIQQNL